MRNGAKNKFEKDFYKLMNNAVFGKTMENVENRRYSITNTLGKNGRKVGASTNASLLYTDTDLLIIKVYADNFYNFIKDNQNEFDTSNYKADNKFNVPVSQSVLGNESEDEFPADPIICFYGTGAKAYYVQSTENELKESERRKEMCY
ncbi:hypothetical protein NQ318_022549 [Aromia moschata]|uniref:DNA-directed DNA polymerase n=1 Tax=Aromia moschata TaxID=1265417 RepID=A0AAV8XKI2_9CUCU|nr:hypothetical protein NQ318_022549 [Aromia moschata]